MTSLNGLPFLQAIFMGGREREEDTVNGAAVCRSPHDLRAKDDQRREHFSNKTR